MDKYQELRAEARQRLKNADHLITMSYPMVQDSKLLLAAAKYLSLAVNKSMLSLLYYERAARRIPPFHDDLDSSLNAFINGVMPRYPIDKNYIKLMTDLDALVRLHEESPVEFTRKDKYVMADRKFELTELTYPLLKDLLERSKRFIEEMEILVSKG